MKAEGRLRWGPQAFQANSNSVPTDLSPFLRAGRGTVGFFVRSVISSSRLLNCTSRSRMGVPLGSTQGTQPNDFPTGEAGNSTQLLTSSGTLPRSQAQVVRKVCSQCAL